MVQEAKVERNRNRMIKRICSARSIMAVMIFEEGSQMISKNENIIERGTRPTNNWWDTGRMIERSTTTHI